MSDIKRVNPNIINNVISTGQQINIPINLSDTTHNKLKEQAIEIANLTLRNNSLSLDSLLKAFKIRKLQLQIKQSQYTIDSLKWVYRNYQPIKDSLSSLRKEILNLSYGGVILYQLDKNKNDIFYIDLRYYDVFINDKDGIKLIPFKNGSKRSKIRVDGLPMSDNLSLHFYPHDFDGHKIEF